MRVISAGYEFAHRDDYEGREVLPTIKVDADSRNIEELEVEADAERFQARRSPEQLEALKAGGFTFSDYEGMMRQMDKQALVIDDISHHEMDKLIELYRPDVVCCGIKEKFIVEKMGVPCKQLHSYDYGGPYAVFTGAANFYREIDRMVNTRVWKMILPPWQKHPELGARPVFSPKARKPRNPAPAAAPARAVRPERTQLETLDRAGEPTC